MSKKYNVLVCCHNSLLYLTGAFLRFSNSNDGSTANSFPALFLKALVHLALRGFFFFLKFLWHFERQNLNIWKIIIRFVEYSIKRLKLKRLKISCQMAASTLLTMRFLSYFRIWTYFTRSDLLNTGQTIDIETIEIKLSIASQHQSYWLMYEILTYFKIWTYFAIISNKLDTFSGINRWTTEETLFNPHFRVLLRGQGL